MVTIKIFSTRLEVFPLDFFFFFFLFFRKKNILKELSFLKINHAMTNVSRKDGEHFTCDDIFAVLCMKKILFFLFQGTKKESYSSND